MLSAPSYFRFLIFFLIAKQSTLQLFDVFFQCEIDIPYFLSIDFVQYDRHIIILVTV